MFPLTSKVFKSIVVNRRNVMSLRRINENVFVDLTALTFVRFEDMDQDATAVLKFKDGGTETMSGESVRNLHRHLIGSTADNEQTLTLQPVEESEVEVDIENQLSPSRGIKIG